MKNKFLLLLSLLFVFILGGCGQEASSAEEVSIGISMPSKALERWERDGQYMVKQFNQLGYDTNIQYAEGGVETQVDQIENLITRDVDAIVIAAIDGEALSAVVDRANENGIPVFAYDRLIMHTENVDYYVTFDLIRVGEIQGEYIVQSLGLNEGEGPFNIELFGGSPDDNNARYFFEGAMNVLQPYIDNGQLVVRSGQTNFNQMAIQDWDGARAQTRMDDILSASYSDETLHAVLSPNDALALGIISSLEAFGYGTEQKPLPVITGQDAETASVQSIINGKQTMTVFKNTEELATVTVEMVRSMMEGDEVPVNDTETYYNGEIIVPANLLEAFAVDITNYEEVLIDSGYIDESALTR